MKALNKVILVTSKGLEIVHWLAAGLMAAGLVCSVAARDWLGGVLQKGIEVGGNTLSTYGFEMSVVDARNTIHMTAVMLFFISAIMILSLMAMVFRNVFLILKTAQGHTPFQNDVVRMLREIGIFMISIPLIGLVMSGISRLVLGVESIESSVRFESFVIGILVLCLTQAFVYGIRLQKDVDGLL